jgi:hypothetical protein
LTCRRKTENRTSINRFQQTEHLLDSSHFNSHSSEWSLGDLISRKEETEEEELHHHLKAEVLGQWQQKQ